MTAWMPCALFLFCHRVLCGGGIQPIMPLATHGVMPTSMTQAGTQARLLSVQTIRSWRPSSMLQHTTRGRRCGSVHASASNLSCSRPRIFALCLTMDVLCTSMVRKLCASISARTRSQTLWRHLSMACVARPGTQCPCRCLFLREPTAWLLRRFIKPAGAQGLQPCSSTRSARCNPSFRNHRVMPSSARASTYAQLFGATRRKDRLSDWSAHCASNTALLKARSK